MPDHDLIERLNLTCIRSGHSLDVHTPIPVCIEAASAITRLIAERDAALRRAEAFNNLAASWGQQGEGQMLRAEAAEARVERLEGSLKRAEAALEDVCKLSAILGEPDNPHPPHVVRFGDGSEERGSVADLAVEIVLSVNLAAKQAASVLSDLRDVLKEQA